jgi:hypothetical protein
MGFRDDERAQSIQVGAVLLFGVLVVLFAIYQAAIVPNQNQQVEFNHNQRVQGDMVQLRNAVLETKSTGEDAFVSVELGTQFPPRLLGLNPPSPTGVLQTTAERPVIVEQGGADITGSVCPGSDVTTRSIAYSPSYSEFDSAGILRYENSLLYHNYTENAVVLSGQQLVQGDRVQLIPLNRSFREASSRTVSVDLKPGLLDTSQRDDINVTLPTRLPEATWEEALSGEVDPANVSVTTGAAGRNLTLTLSGTYTISCGPVGVGEAPASGGRGTGADEINPAAPGDVRLVSEQIVQNGNDYNVTLIFNNTGGTNNFTEARVNFYSPTNNNNNPPTEVTINGTTLQVPGDFTTLTENVRLRGGGVDTEVVLDFNNRVRPGDFFVITFELETGETALYFVAPT